MQFHRRALLVGIGTTAVGSGAVFGSGAFTQVQATRDLTIGVDEDSTALLALEQNPDISAVFSHDNGELAIDTARVGSGTGFNTGAVVQIGETHSELPDAGSAQVVNTLRESAGTGAAFKLTNNFNNVPAAEGNSNALDIVVSVDDLDGPSSELVLIGTAYYDGTTDTQVASTENPQQAAFKAVPPDTPIYFAIQLRTVSTTDPADFDGTVSFRAGPSLTGAFPTSDEAQATTVDILTQPDNQQSVETPLTGPPSVIVTDPFGDPVSGVDVTAAVDGADVTAVATTGADGNADFSGAQGNLSDIMLAIDTSGSIGGDPLDSAKTEAKNLIDAVDANFGLVSFGGDATLEEDLNTSDETVKETINSLSGGGTTPMADAIDTSQAELESDRASVSPNLIVVLADGAPDTLSLTREAATTAKSAGTTLLSIAFTDGADQDLMEDISSNPTADGTIDEDDPNAFQAGEDDLSTVFDSIAAAVPDNAIVINSTGEYTVDFSIDGTDESVLNDASVTSESFSVQGP